jgi:hypothetical protein
MVARPVGSLKPVNPTIFMTLKVLMLSLRSIATCQRRSWCCSRDCLVAICGAIKGNLVRDHENGSGTCQPWAHPFWFSVALEFREIPKTIAAFVGRASMTWRA